MITQLIRCGVLAFALLPAAAAAAPVTLKFAYLSSDRAATYHAAIKPFVDAVNSDGVGLVQIEMHFSGALGPKPSEQLQLVLDGTADLAFIVPGYTPEQFRDNALIELPGLYQSIREATLVYTRLIAANALSGYQDLFVVGAYATEPEVFHTREPVGSLDDLRGKRIRVNNPMQAAVLTKLGIVPKATMPINTVASAIGRDEIDGATAPPAMLFEFGISRMAAHHYLLRIGVVPLAVVMNRKAFERLSPEAQDIIRKYSGEWAARQFFTYYDPVNRDAFSQLRSDPKRKVVVPSPEDDERARAAFQDTAKEWLEAELRRQPRWTSTKAEIEKIRSGQ